MTHFDALLGFCGNAHCLPIRIGRSRNLVGLAIASYSLKICFHQTFESPCRKPRWSRAQLFPIILVATKFSKLIYPTRWTTGTLVLYWFHVLGAPSPEKGVMLSGPNASCFLNALMSLRLVSDLSVRIETRLAGCIRARGAFSCAHHWDLPLLYVARRILTVL